MSTNIRPSRRSTSRTCATIVNPGGTNERFAKQFFPHSQLIEYPDNVTIFKQILDGKADVMVTDASETLLQQKLNPGLCSVHPDKPFQFGEKAYLCRAATWRSSNTSTSGCISRDRPASFRRSSTSG